MARENFLWGAPRIHGELLMLGFTVSQATVSRYVPTANRRPGQSWRTFIRNQALAFRYEQDSEDESAGDDAGLRIRFFRGTLVSFATPIGALLTYDCGYPLPALGAQPISPRSARHNGGVWHQARRPWAVSDRSWPAVSDRGQVAVPMRGPPYHTRASPCRACCGLRRSDQPTAVLALVTQSALQYGRSDCVIANSPSRRSN